HAVHPITAVQTEYSLWTRDVEPEILPTLQELGIALVPYSPLGRGFLSGRFTTTEELDEGDYRRHGPRFSGENLEHNRMLAERVRELAVERGITPGQLALAWVLHRGEHIVPIPGTKRVSYLEENLVVAQLLHLESQDPEKDIAMYINSPGGSIYSGLAVYDTMRFIKPDIQTMGVGVAMSMGSLLLAGGTKGKRAALPNSRILIHQPSAGFRGQSTDIEIHAREILNVRGRIEQIYAEHTGRPAEQVRADMERDRFFTAQQALEYGIIDRVLDHH